MLPIIIEPAVGVITGAQADIILLVGVGLLAVRAGAIDPISQFCTPIYVPQAGLKLVANRAADRIGAQDPGIGLEHVIEDAGAIGRVIQRVVQSVEFSRQTGRRLKVEANAAKVIII